MMKEEGFSVGEEVIINKGASITANNGIDVVKKLAHSQKITITQLLNKDGDRPLLVCWQEGKAWYEARVEDCVHPNAVKS